MKYFLYLALLSATSASLAQTTVKDINFGATADLVLPTMFESSAENKPTLRGAEISVYGPIDHLFSGTLIFSGKEKDGEINVGLEEGFISTSKLIPQSKVRAGKFLLNVGRLNNYHPHDWPFITAPRVFREFFSPGASVLDAESAKDTGFEYTWLVPTKSFFEITVGAVNGYCFGECTPPLVRPPYPTFYVHPSTFVELGTGRGLLIGASFLKRIDATKISSDLSGFDLTYKVRDGKTLRWLVQSEAYYQEQSGPASSLKKQWGAYLFPAYGFDAEWNIGLRADYYATADGTKDRTLAGVPTLTYSPSEFTKLRLAYSHETTWLTGLAARNDRQIQLQLVYILGAHPVHDF